MRRERHAWRLLAVGALLPFLLLAFFAQRSYGLRLEAAEQLSLHNTRIIAEHVLRILDMHRKVLALADLASSRSGPELDALLRHETRDSPAVSVVAVTDGRGVITHGSRAGGGVDLSDRDYFQQAMRGDGVAIGRTIVGRVSGESVFVLAMRRRPPSAGIVLVSLRAEYFADFFRRIGEGPFAVSALIRDDGVILARDPGLDQEVRLRPDGPALRLGDDRDHVTYRVTAQTDGRERIYTSVKLAGFPLVVSHGIDVGTVMAGWYRDLALGAVLAGMGSLLLASLGYLFLRQVRRDREIEARLQALVEERTAEALRRATDAERANQQKSRFLAAASHDLRQPAQALRLLLDTLPVVSDPARRREIVDHASVALGGLEELLQALLDVSVLDAGIVEPSVQDVPLGPLLDRLARQFAPQARMKGLALRMVPSSAVVRSDPVMLGRILGNLVSNAIKYTERGALLLGARRRAGQVRVEVWDTGVGFGEEQRQLIFEDFYQVSNEARDRRLGLGLGLGVVRRTADILGHAIDCRSVPGKGSVFSVTAPCAAPPRQDADGGRLAFRTAEHA